MSNLPTNLNRQLFVYKTKCATQQIDSFSHSHTFN